MLINGVVSLWLAQERHHISLFTIKISHQVNCSSLLDASCHIPCVCQPSHDMWMFWVHETASFSCNPLAGGWSTMVGITCRHADWLCCCCQKLLGTWTQRSWRCQMSRTNRPECHTGQATLLFRLTGQHCYWGRKGHYVTGSAGVMCRN